MATIQAIQTLVAAVAAGFAAGSKLADAIHATFEPSKTVELCRAIYGDDFALVQREKTVDGKRVQVKLTAAQELDHARYQAIAYACRVLVSRGQWPKAARAAGAGKGKPGKGKGKGKAGAGKATGETDGPAMLAGLVKAAKFADLLPLLLARKDAARLANGLAAGLAGEDDPAE